MTISYNWLSEYLPEKLDPQDLSVILTSIGLEVESMESYESIKGSLKNLMIGEVIACEQHPNADKLKLTRVRVNENKILQIVCGAPNVAKGQKVVVAPVGSTIFPISADPVTMKLAKIRGIESEGMICAEDEIGIAENHAGIIVLPDDVPVGTAASEYYKPYHDTIYEIGLTPNRMDAMSHLGVARDVATYLSYHNQKAVAIKTPYGKGFQIDDHSFPINVTIENKEACQRYSGISITGLTVKASPPWLIEKLKAIGVRAINNIVDATNYVLHESGQPLHAFDADAIRGKQIIVKTLPADSSFITLDGKERKLDKEDLMICDEIGPMCIAGIFGGIESGVKESTTKIFLESAWFDPAYIRRSSFRHGLRTDAALRFEKGIDISNTVNVLKRAAGLITEIAGGKISSEIVDIYPNPKQKKQIVFRFDYLKKLSGKTYNAKGVSSILNSLGFEIFNQTDTELQLNIPFHKTDISIEADVVEEILRIDGYDNVEIPSRITITPAVQNNAESLYKERLTGFLTGIGFNEILTNSITNSAYFDEPQLKHAVRMLNSLSAELNLMRPSLLETGLEAIAYNLNRRSYDLKFFEFGRSYSTEAVGVYSEKEHLCIYVTGMQSTPNWKSPGKKTDYYYGKGICEHLLRLTGFNNVEHRKLKGNNYEFGSEYVVDQKAILKMGLISNTALKRFDIKQPVFFAELDWQLLMEIATRRKTTFKELSKQLPVYRDLSLIVSKNLNYEDIQKTINEIKLDKLEQLDLFDVFENEKLGQGKKSLAISFRFLDEQKTLTDKEVDSMMSRIISTLDKELKAEIRK